MHLLLIEDLLGGSDLLAAKLSGAGFKATRVQSPGEALTNVNSQRAQALLIDQHNAAMPAAHLVRPLREGGLHQPLIVLSPNLDWRDKVESLNIGADDYVTKPIRSEEVAARLRAIIRRGAGQSSNQIVIGGLDLDLRDRCAWLDGRCLDLTRNEFRLLRALMLSPSHSASRGVLRQALGMNGAGLTNNAVEVQVARLRRKVGPDLIRTIRGVGYQLAIAPGDPDKTLPPRGPCGTTRTDSSSALASGTCRSCQ